MRATIQRPITYDNMDRLATRKDALQAIESYQYDGNGNRTQFTDRRNKVTTFQYDENVALVDAADHAGIHQAMRSLERIGAAAVNPATTTGRILVNLIGRGCGCN